jgi:hypothetical protein
MDYGMIPGRPLDVGYTWQNGLYRMSHTRVNSELYGEKYTTWDLKGLLWCWQGWNDLIYNEKVEKYEENLKALIRNLRIDLNETALPVVIGIL